MSTHEVLKSSDMQHDENTNPHVTQHNTNAERKPTRIMRSSSASSDDSNANSVPSTIVLSDDSDDDEMEITDHISKPAIGFPFEVIRRSSADLIKYFMYRLPDSPSKCLIFRQNDDSSNSLVLYCVGCREHFESHNGKYFVNTIETTHGRKFNGFSLASNPCEWHQSCCRPLNYSDVIEQYQLIDEAEQQRLYVALNRSKASAENGEFLVTRIFKYNYSILYRLPLDNTKCCEMHVSRNEMYCNSCKKLAVRTGCSVGGSPETSVENVNKGCGMAFTMKDENGELDAWLDEDPVDASHLPECSPMFTEKVLSTCRIVLGRSRQCFLEQLLGCRNGDPNNKCATQGHENDRVCRGCRRLAGIEERVPSSSESTSASENINQSTPYSLRKRPAKPIDYYIIDKVLGNALLGLNKELRQKRAASYYSDEDNIHPSMNKNVRVDHSPEVEADSSVELGDASCEADIEPPSQSVELTFLDGEFVVQPRDAGGSDSNPQQHNNVPAELDTEVGVISGEQSHGNTTPAGEAFDDLVHPATNSRSLNQEPSDANNDDMKPDLEVQVISVRLGKPATKRTVASEESDVKPDIGTNAVSDNAVTTNVGTTQANEPNITASSAVPPSGSPVIDPSAVNRGPDIDVANGLAQKPDSIDTSRQGNDGDALSRSPSIDRAPTEANEIPDVLPVIDPIKVHEPSPEPTSVVPHQTDPTEATSSIQPPVSATADQELLDGQRVIPVEECWTKIFNTTTFTKIEVSSKGRTVTVQMHRAAASVDDASVTILLTQELPPSIDLGSMRTIWQPDQLTLTASFNG